MSGTLRARGALRRYGPWVAASAAAMIGTASLQIGGSSAFERFLGPLPPVLAVGASAAAGLGALVFLEQRGFWRPPCGARVARGLVLATVLSGAFTAAAITADVAFGFGRDMNVGWPEAWAFYPSIVIVAETVFHLLPLAALVWVTGQRFAGRSLAAPVWPLVLLTAAIEPIAQVVLGSGLPGFTVAHVYLLGIVELVLLRRYGYVPMLWFRLSYYLLWHVLWGAARLELL